VSFLAPSFLWLLALAVPVVVLYFFRQRQQDLLVPTSFLWAEALRDTRAAAVLRKFLKSVLLLLQLLFLALAVLALAGATAELLSGRAPRLVVALLDRSASMGVRDAGGRTRMEAAKEALLGAVDGLRGEDRMMVAAVDARAEVLVPFTGERARLRAAVGRVEVRDLPTDFSDAAVLLRAQRTASTGRETEVLVLSDGAFPDPGTLEGTKVSFVPLGEAVDNAGITDVKVVRSPGAPPALFVSVECFGGSRSNAPWRCTAGSGSSTRGRSRRPRGRRRWRCSPSGGWTPGPRSCAFSARTPSPGTTGSPWSSAPIPRGASPSTGRGATASWRGSPTCARGSSAPRLR